MGSFTPLAFGTNRGMGKECRFFHSNLAYKNSLVRAAGLMPVPYLGSEHVYRLMF